MEGKITCLEYYQKNSEMSHGSGYTKFMARIWWEYIMMNGTIKG